MNGETSPASLQHVTGSFDAKALEVVEAIFRDLRDRRFLKWIFDERGDACFIANFADGEPLKGLDLEVQGEIKASWQAIISRALTPAPQTHRVGLEAAIRKAGQVSIDHLVDTSRIDEAGPNDLADYLTRIVDACVAAALAHPSPVPREAGQ
ncbi:hypothetical protein GOL99_26760 [Sinorhizobium medicae]|nr:hypothetical protein [Sinorhizobium medicae]